METVIERDSECLVCLNHEFERFRDRACKEQRIVNTGIRHKFECSICGIYEVTGLAYLQLPRDTLLINRKMRAAVSHKFKLGTLNGQFNEIEGNKKLIRHFKESKLPGIQHQLTSIIKLVGDGNNEVGGELSGFPVDFHSIIGSLNRDSALKLVQQLFYEGFIKYNIDFSVSGRKFSQIYLTMEKGWDYYKKNFPSLIGNENELELTVE